MSEKPKGRWVSVEARTADGAVTVPPGWAESTAGTRYDPGEHTDLELLILSGYTPPVLMASLKIYKLRSLDMKGWRLRSIAVVELEPWRVHEKDWFAAFSGGDAVISDPGTPDTTSTEYRLKVTSSMAREKYIYSDYDPQGGRPCIEGQIPLLSHKLQGRASFS